MRPPYPSSSAASRRKPKTLSGLRLSPFPSSNPYPKLPRVTDLPWPASKRYSIAVPKIAGYTRGHGVSRVKTMEHIIPAELHNPQALRKMKNLYAQQLAEHGEDCPMLIKLHRDIETLEREFMEDEPLFATRAAFAATR